MAHEAKIHHVLFLVENVKYHHGQCSAGTSAKNGSFGI